MSLDFSPVKMSSSSRTTSSVFQMITLSSNLEAGTRDRWCKTKSSFKLAHSLSIRKNKSLLKQTTNVLLWFSWRDVEGWARCRHVFREHVHPHLNSPLRAMEQIWIFFFCKEQDNELLAKRWCDRRGCQTCSIPGLSGWSNGLVSTCSGMSLQPTRGISSQWFSTVRARCSSVCFFKPVESSNPYGSEWICITASLGWKKKARCRWWSPFSSSISVGAMKTRFSTFTLPAGP